KVRWYEWAAKSTPGGPSQMSTPARTAATTAEAIHSRASSRRSSPLTGRSLLRAQTRPDAEVGAPVGVDVLRAQNALEPEAVPFGHTLGADIAGSDQELQPLELQLVEGPAGQEPDRAGR